MTYILIHYILQNRVRSSFWFAYTIDKFLTITEYACSTKSWRSFRSCSSLFASLIFWTHTSTSSYGSISWKHCELLSMLSAWDWYTRDWFTRFLKSLMFTEFFRLLWDWILLRIFGVCRFSGWAVLFYLNFQLFLRDILVCNVDWKFDSSRLHLQIRQ